MTGLRKILGGVSCGVLLCVGVGFSDVAWSADKMTRESGSGKVIIGNLLRIEGNNYFVKNREDGKEVCVYVDKTTQMNGVGVAAGDSVMVQVNDQNHVKFILADQKNLFR